MFKWAQAMRLRAAAFPGIVDTHKAIVGLAYLAGYVALDRISFVQPYAPFGITPWNLEGYVRSPARRSGVREGDLT